MSEYEKLWAAWASGQITPAQWLRHLEDQVFAAWLKRREPIQKSSPKIPN